MKFMFIGNPRKRDDLNEVVVFGKTFPLRIPVEVTDERAIGKLKANGHFKVVDDVAVAETAADVPATAIDADGADPVATTGNARRARKA